MSNITRNLKLLWRSEQVLAEAKISLASKKLVLGVAAGIFCLFALGMFNLALFFALEPRIGLAWSATAVGALDVLIAGLLALFARNLPSVPEEEIAREVRDIALAEIGAEVDQMQAGLQQLRYDVQTARDGITQFVNRPMDVLSPAVIGAAITAITKLIKARKN
ncbi:MAG: phage holin family protein [Rhizobiaceae bacterium]